MTFVNDLTKDLQTSDSESDGATLDSRVDRLERELGRTRRLLDTVLVRLEELLEEDLSGDGQVGT